jgi:serine/threonine protein kinase
MGKDILNVGGFTIIRRIGNGARSTIYLATDDEDGSTVALKRVILERPEDQRVIEQTEMEYRVAKDIDHPYVRKCFKLKKIRTMFKVRELLLSMEHVDGKTLEENPTLSLGDVLLVFRMVATGLSAMHQRGYIHCDMKPNNILLGKNGAIKIIDLGQSCRIGTIKTRIQGTPDYIAPEQVKRKTLTPKTDIFNLGATMYWALTGKNVPTLIPKNHGTVALVEPPKCPSPQELKEQLPQDISTLVMNCVKNDPTERPASMSDIVSALDTMIYNIFGEKIKANRNAAENHRSAQ